MKLITLAQARDHCKADGDDDDLITVYADAAEAACARLANRNLYATASELATAIGGVPAAMTTAYATYDADVAIANSQDDTRIQTMMLAQAQVSLDKATNNVDAIIHGLALDTIPGDDIVCAVLMTTGHFYRNRENVITGQGAAAIEVPMSAQNIMSNNRWLGPL